MTMEELKTLAAHYKALKGPEVVYRVELKTTAGIHGIGNQAIINKIVDLLISEVQKQIEEELKND